MRPYPLFDNIQTGARISLDRVYRYELWRIWDTHKPLCNFLMLNPSTADEVDNDPTVERCERRCRMWGYGGLIVTNIFAFRATHPVDMKAATEPVGADNDAAILSVAERSSLIVCAWGKDGTFKNRSVAVMLLLADHADKLHSLKMSDKTGQPYHPLYLPYSLQPARMVS